MVLCLRNHCEIQGNEDFLLCFVVLTLKSESLTNFELVFICGVR